jgi:Fe-S-cluster containining protein
MNLEDIYNKIPTLKCDPTCKGECCGPIAMTKSEWSKFKDKKDHKNINCPYLIDGKCSEYENRPFICRIFGTVEHGLMKCPKGCKPEHPLTLGQLSNLNKQYNKICKSEGEAGPKGAYEFLILELIGAKA